MRSLTTKLTLAFLFVSIIGVALTALFVRQRTQREFDRFVLDRYQSDLIKNLTDYYNQNGSWTGIDNILVRDQTPRHNMFNRVWMPAPLTLIDARGEAVFNSRRYRAGQLITEKDLKNSVPIEVNDETVGWVLFTSLGNQVIPPTESPESIFLKNMNLAILFGALGAIAIALVLGTFLARTISQPVREITAATQQVAQGDLGTQVPVRAGDELGELATSFNQMSADLAQANEMRRQMTADIAHDLRTPLSVILGYTESLSSGRLEPSPETFDIMHAKARHLQHLIDDLRTLALADAGELPLAKRPVSPDALLEHTALAHMVQAQKQAITLGVEAEPDLPSVIVDPERFAQVLGNLVSNALRYTPEGGQIVLRSRKDLDSVLLQVHDNGSGIAPEDLPHIFKRFYRAAKARPQNGESGLGLAIAKSIVEVHEGTIAVESPPGQGTTFTIRLPAGPIMIEE
jgi:signal transduction histidine kinase